MITLTDLPSWFVSSQLLRSYKERWTIFIFLSLIWTFSPFDTIFRKPEKFIFLSSLLWHRNHFHQNQMVLFLLSSVLSILSYSLEILPQMIFLIFLLDHFFCYFTLKIEENLLDGYKRETRIPYRKKGSEIFPIPYTPRYFSIFGSRFKIRRFIWKGNYLVFETGVEDRLFELT